jgi:2,4-dienoyl-CoA reductase-like NADH-dependent reductase (Old Yellow Enzyme family)
VTLLNLIENHLRKTGVPPTRFGREAVRDPRLVRDMRQGREVRPRMEARVRAYLAKTGAPA